MSWWHGGGVFRFSEKRQNEMIIMKCYGGGVKGRFFFLWSSLERWKAQV